MSPATMATLEPDYAEEIREFHRPLWEEWKAGGVARDDVGRALYDLMFQGYCPSEIALWFGVSRERVRQWIERHGIPVEIHGTKPREWDDKLRRFRPVTPKALRQRQRYRAKRKKVGKKKQRRREMVAVIRRLTTELGRSPTHREIGVAMGKDWPPGSANSTRATLWMAQLWGRPWFATHSRRSREYQRYCHRAYRLAGVEVRDAHSTKAGMSLGQARQFDHDVIRALRAAGWTARRVAEALGCSESTVYAVGRVGD